MALSLPSTSVLYSFWGPDADTSDSDRATLFIELAADLLWMATNLEDNPTDTRLNTLVQYAICDMAIYLFVNRNDLDAVYSPFQSENIGSYSYSRALKAAVTGQATGVALFDKVVAYFLDLAMNADGNGWAVSENVFRKGYEPLFIDAFWGVQPSLWGDRNSWYVGSSADQDGRYWNTQLF